MYDGMTVKKKCVRVLFSFALLFIFKTAPLSIAQSFYTHRTSNDERKRKKCHKIIQAAAIAVTLSYIHPDERKETVEIKNEIHI
jgi:hypothetical protein